MVGSGVTRASLWDVWKWYGDGVALTGYTRQRVAIFIEMNNLRREKKGFGLRHRRKILTLWYQGMGMGIGRGCCEEWCFLGDAFCFAYEGELGMAEYRGMIGDGYQDKGLVDVRIRRQLWFGRMTVPAAAGRLRLV